MNRSWAVSFVWGSKPEDSRWIVTKMEPGSGDDVHIESGEMLRHEREDFDGEFTEHDPDGHTRYAMDEMQYIDTYNVKSDLDGAVDAARSAILRRGTWGMLEGDPVFSNGGDVWVEGGSDA